MEVSLPFGQLLRDRRKARDLTQEELARRVGCARVTIRKIEYGDLRPSLQIAQRLADTLGVRDEDRAAFLRLARSTPPNARPPARLFGGDAIADLAGRVVKGYTLHECIGMGRFGAVYRATQAGVGRDVAIKIIRPQVADHPDFIRGFEADAHIVARLEHPHIVPLYDYWREPGGAYLVMRYMRGAVLPQRSRHATPIWSCA